MKKKEKKDYTVYIILGIVVLVLFALLIRMKSSTGDLLICKKDITAEYHEELRFRYDITNELYSYNRVEHVHGMSEQSLQDNYNYFNEQYEELKENLNENFKYNIERQEDGSILVTTYINVKVYSSFFNDYINNESIKSNTPIKNVKEFLVGNGYECNIEKE